MKQNLIFWLCGVFIVGYAIIYAAAGYETAAYIIAGLLFGLGVMVCWDWAATGIKALKNGRDADAILAFGLLIVGVYAIHTRVVTVVKIALGFPSWLDTHWISQFAGVELLIFFSAVILATGRQEGGAMPNGGIARFIVAGFLAGCFVGAAVAFALRGQTPVVIEEKRPAIGMSSNLPRLACDDPGRPILVNAFCRRK